MAWANLVDARLHWPDAAAIDDVPLTELLTAAHEACLAYAPAYTEPVSISFKLANIFQAREIFTASRRDEADIIGVGDYAIRARPLTAAVKQLLRPTKRVMEIG